MEVAHYIQVEDHSLEEAVGHRIQTEAHNLVEAAGHTQVEDARHISVVEATDHIQTEAARLAAANPQSAEVVVAVPMPTAHVVSDLDLHH